MEVTRFSQNVVKWVKKIPPGKVASYGQVAAYIGSPKAARQVGWTLRQLKVSLPWWRVINSAGRISIKGNKFYNADMQKDLLRRDGVEVGDDLSVNIGKFRWSGNLKSTRRNRSSP